jgi:two-component sensor histidine kinase
MIGGSIMSGRAASPVSLNLVEEINHRVVNEYSEAIASLHLAASRSKDDSIKRELHRVTERLHDHAQAHRALMPPRSDLGENLADYVGRICNSFARATLAERGLMLVLDAEDITLSADRCWRIGLIVAELVRNAARHARFNSAGRISVRIAECGSEVTCMVRDTGAPKASAVPGRGQHLIRSLVGDLAGEVHWSFTSEGCAAFVRIPATSPGNGAASNTYTSDLVVPQS